MFKADLHCHSCVSDGSYQPKELISIAKERGLQALSITDHDTIGAYDELRDSALNLGTLTLIPGVELSTTFREEPVHILGYSFDLTSQSLREFCHYHYKRRQERFRIMLGKANKLGLEVSEEEILKEFKKENSLANLGRPHLAMMMFKKKWVRSVADAFHKFLGEGQSCYEPSELPSVEETIKQIHQAGGLAVLAHPHLIKREGVIPALLNMPFDGLEGYYSLFCKSRNERWVKTAAHKKWIVTGGSDFHGTPKPRVRLGCAWAPENTVQLLIDHLKKHG
jgi:3',5'-nucleoside bisphosphate phosphatase